MGERKMEFDCEAGPSTFGPVAYDEFREHRSRMKMMKLMNTLEEAEERLETSKAVDGLSTILHDLDEDCRCDTCTEVREIRARHGQ